MVKRKRQDSGGSLRKRRSKKFPSNLGKRKHLNEDGSPALRPKPFGDLSVPGYNYIGPFNAMDDYDPVDADDYVAYIHDKMYQLYMDEGYTPYLWANKADDWARDHFSKNVIPLIGKAVFGAKGVAGDAIPMGRIPEEVEERVISKIDLEDAERVYQEYKEYDMPKYDDWHRRPQPVEVTTDHLGGIRGPPHVIPGDDDMEVTASANAKSASTRSGMGGETPITPIPKAVYSPFPKTINVIMPWHGYYSTTLAAGFSSTDTVTTYSFRLNSIYDVTYDLTAQAQDPTPAADVQSGTVNNPGMRNYWMNFYTYWTVMNTRYRVKAWITTDGTGHEIAMYCYFHGQQQPPKGEWINNANRIEHPYRKRHPNMYYKFLHSEDRAKSGRNYLNNKTIAEGVFKPGSIANLVAEDEFHETWHRGTEVPSYREILTLMFQRTPQSANAICVVNFTIDLEYEVQLKDLKAQHEYQAADSAISAIAAYPTIS